MCVLSEHPSPSNNSCYVFKKKGQEFRVMSEDVELSPGAMRIGAHFFLYSEGRSIRAVVSLCVFQAFSKYKQFCACNEQYWVIYMY